MADTNAARRWARALVGLAAEAQVEEAVLRDLDEVVDAATREGGMLLGVLSSPVFQVEERKGVLDAVLQRIGVQPLTRNFLGLLVDRGRFDIVPDVARIFREAMDQRAGRLRVQVSTVDPLSPDLERELVAAFERATGKTVMIEASVDPSLIGGLVARIGGKVYDASLKTRLEDLQRRLVHAHALPVA